LARPCRLLRVGLFCINQSDDIEKGHQIQIMAEIYKKSCATFVWLGPIAKHFPKAAPLIIEAYRQLPDEIEQTEDDLISACLFTWESQEIDGMRDVACLLGCSWFRRAWIVQEIVMGKGIFFLVENELTTVIPWEWLEAALILFDLQQRTALRYPDLQVDLPRLIENLLSIGKSAVHFQRLRDLRNCAEMGYNPSLLQNLDAIRAFKASDPRDKVYACLGMSLKHNIHVDYKLSVSETFISTTRNWLENTQNLALLGLCRHSPNMSLPSWVPDFTLDHERNPLGTSLRSIGNERRTVYSSGGNEPAQLRFTENNTLVIRGVLLGELSFIASSTARDQFLGPPIDKSMSGSSLVSMSKEIDLIGNLEKLLRTWLAEWRCYEKSRIDSAYLWTCNSTKWALIRTLFADVTISFQSKAMTKQRLDKEYPELSFEGLTRETLPQRIFAASSLHQLCLAPEEARIGDVMFVPLGSETPFLLRNTSTGGYKIIGDCYVHGFMDGEALRWMRAFTEGSPNVELSII
jgi:Heterokaryon incompatibility protein (HET)